MVRLKGFFVFLPIFFLSIGTVFASHSADLNGDGKVDEADLNILKSQWMATGTADLNHNGIVNTQDAGILLSAWGTIPTTPPPPPPTGTRDPFLWPFDTYSPWNMPIGSGAQYADISGNPNWNLSTINMYFNGPNGHTVAIWKATSSDPLRTLNVRHEVMPNIDPNNSNFCQDTFNGGTFQIRVPDNAQPSPPITWPSYYSGDQQMIVVDPDGKTSHNFYLAAKATDSVNWISYDFYRENIRLDGYGKSSYGYSFPDGDKRCKHSSHSGGGNVMAGLVRSGELKNGIKHVLMGATGDKQVNRYAPNGRSFVWPMSSSDPVDSYYTAGNVYLGSLLAIPYSVNLDTLPFQTVEGKNVARALQQYGFYINSPFSNSNVMVPAIEWTARSEMPAQGSGSPFTQDLKLAAKYLKVVTNNGPNSVGGGGTPLAPLAPPFAP